MKAVPSLRPLRSRPCVCFRRVQRMMGEAMSRRIRGVFNAANFWAIVLYNVLSLNSLEFATLVGGRLVLTGKSERFPLSRRSQRWGIPQRIDPRFQHQLLSSEVLLFPPSSSLFSPSRFPSVHPVRVVCDLLRRPAGEGKRETSSPAGRARAGQTGRRRQEESRVKERLDLRHPSIPSCHHQPRCCTLAVLRPVRDEGRF